MINFIKYKSKLGKVFHLSQAFLMKGDIMSVNLKKGGRLSLTKERPGLNRVVVGLGWDPVKTRGFFGFKRKMW